MPNLKFSQVLFLLPMFLTVILIAEEQNEITVTGSKNTNSDPSSSISSVTAKEIEEKQSVTAGDAVRELSGVYVSGDGRTGQSQFIFVRGFRSSDVLVLIDGVEITNPLSPNGAADLSISPENIAKIELLKGPQPVLFGSGAISGVLNIQTKKGSGPAKLSSNIATGVLDMSSSRYFPDIFSADFSMSGRKDSFFYNGGGSFFYTEGISVADSYKGVKENLYKNKPENDMVIKGNAYLRTGVDIDKNNQWDFILRAGKGKSEIDDGPGLGADDPNRYLDSEDLLFKSGMSSDFFGKTWNMKTDLSILLSSLNDTDKSDSGKVTGDMVSAYNAFQTSLSWTNTINAVPWYELIAGFELKREWGDADYNDNSAGRVFDLSFSPSPDISTGVYAFNVFKPLKKLDISAGIRLQSNFYQIRLADKASDELLKPENKNSTEPLFSVGIAYETPVETVFKARIARGVKTPTLFQRFSSFADMYNELKPETAWGFDGIIQQYLVDRKILFEAGYFYELKMNHIDLDKSGKFSNRYQIENHGLELDMETKQFRGLSLKASYTWIFKMKEFKVVTLNGKKYKDETAVLRRPEHSFNAVLNYNFKKIFNACISLNYVGERGDEVYNYPKTPYIVNADQFVILNLALSYKVNNYLTLFAKIENMLDNDDYAYSVEYGTAGITPWIGFKVETGNK